MILLRMQERPELQELVLMNTKRMEEWIKQIKIMMI